MNLKSLLRTLTAGTALFMLMCFNSAFAQDSVGKVLMIQGKVLAYTDMGDQRTLKNGAAIYEGDTVETIGEGAVVLNFADGTQWDILDQSKVSVLEYVYTPGGSSQDSAKYQVHEGLVTYTGGKMGERGAEIAIQMDDQTVYPEGTIISFFKRQSIKAMNTAQGNARIVTSSRQTVRVKVGQWAVSGAGQTPQVARSSGEAITLIQTVFQRTGVTVTAGGDVRVVAKQIVQTIVKVGNAVVARTKTVDKTIIKADSDGTTTTTTTTTSTSAGAGGSGHPAGYLPATTNLSNLYTLIDIITGGSSGQTYLIDTGTNIITPVSPN
jgi:hypothetical protein